MRREGAKGLRARLNRMSFDALVREFVTEQPAKWEKAVAQFLSLEREEKKQAMRRLVARAMDAKRTAVAGLSGGLIQTPTDAEDAPSQVVQ